MKYTGNDNLEIMKLAKNYNNFLVNLVIDIIKKNNYKSVLDFGCADGFFIEKIKNILKVDIIGVEIDNSSLSLCKKKNLNVTNNINKIQSIDFIYTFNTLEHIENDTDSLKALRQKLSENGRLLIYVPAIKFLYSSMDKKVGHYRRYNKDTLKKILNEAGFYVESISYCDCIGVLATLIYKIKDIILKNNNGNLNPTAIKFYDMIFPLIIILDKIIFKYLCGKNIIAISYPKKQF